MKTLLSMCTLVAATLAAITGCDGETPTSATVADGYPVIAEGGDSSKRVIVYKVWWVTTLFDGPIVPGAESDTLRTVPAEDFAYALLAPGWDPASSAPPATLIPVHSANKLSVQRGETLRIEVGDATFVGNCAAGSPLPQTDADFITQSIFPGDFAAVTYDAKTCASTPVSSDGGVEGGGG